MVLGCYYLTLERETHGKKAIARFGDEHEALLAYDVGRIDTRSRMEDCPTTASRSSACTRPSS
jgi:hypothetical protein